MSVSPLRMIWLAMMSLAVGPMSLILVHVPVVLFKLSMDIVSELNAIIILFHAPGS
jgi:hypothetical protein